MTEPDIKSDGQPYELFVFARRHRIALQQAREILARNCADREASDLEAVMLSLDHKQSKPDFVKQQFPGP